MTKKDFELIAAVLNVNYRNARGDELGAIECVISDFARELQRTNPRFDAGRFIYACKAAR